MASPPSSTSLKSDAGLGCLSGLFGLSRLGHKRTKSVPVRSDAKEKAHHDGAAPLPPSERKAAQRNRLGTLSLEGITFNEGCSCCRLHSSTSESGSLAALGHKPPSYASEDPALGELLKPEILDEIDTAIDELDSTLRQLSLDIWEHPELGFEEHYAHDTLTSFMEKHGFKVTRHYLGFRTAWRAEYTYGEDGRVIGLQSEMDALPNIGHACGHNLIAMIGVAVALGIKAALKKHDIAGKIVLLGTPAEESGGGKIKLLEAGAYRDMDVCLMAHPGPGLPNGTVIQPWIAIQNIDVEFFGHSAHAAFAPWEGQNALDAAFLAYSGISVLRQQMKPTYRVHGVIAGKEWEPNVIPDYSKMRWAVRAPTWAELEVLRERVVACFEAAGHATSCKVIINHGIGYKDCKQNSRLGAEYVRTAASRYDMNAKAGEDLIEASTDLGDISYALPTIQSVFSIPITKNGSNHTPQFAETARSLEAHRPAIQTSKALAATALRVLIDDDFYDKVRDSHELSP